MHRKSPLPDFHLGMTLISCALLPLAVQCVLSGSVVDRGRFETNLSDMRLKHHRTLEVYYGGSKREIPLKLISTVIIDPSVTMTIGNTLYFSADITLKDGTRIRSLEKDQTNSTRAFVSIQDELVGKNEEDSFIIGLEDVSRITVH